MTKKITISVPDDVADHLAHVSNVSGYVSESVRRRIRSEEVRRVLGDAGVDITEDAVAAARAQRQAALATITPELRAEAAALHEVVTGSTR
jgi:hypothetical protein